MKAFSDVEFASLSARVLCPHLLAENGAAMARSMAMFAPQTSKLQKRQDSMFRVISLFDEVEWREETSIERNSKLEPIALFQEVMTGIDFSEVQVMREHLQVEAFEKAEGRFLQKQLEDARIILAKEPTSITVAAGSSVKKIVAQEGEMIVVSPVSLLEELRIPASVVDYIIQQLGRREFSFLKHDSRYSALYKQMLRLGCAKEEYILGV